MKNLRSWYKDAILHIPTERLCVKCKKWEHHRRSEFCDMCFKMLVQHNRFQLERP